MSLSHGLVPDASVSCAQWTTNFSHLASFTTWISCNMFHFTTRTLGINLLTYYYSAENHSILSANTCIYNIIPVSLEDDIIVRVLDSYQVYRMNWDITKLLHILIISISCYIIKLHIQYLASSSPFLLWNKSQSQTLLWASAEFHLCILCNTLQGFINVCNTSTFYGI